MKNSRAAAILYALAAALFYALNVPCSKLLLEHISPTMLAGFLYLGAGLGVGIMYLFHFPKEHKEERLSRCDLPYTIPISVRRKHWAQQKPAPTMRSLRLSARFCPLFF